MFSSLIVRLVGSRRDLIPWMHGGKKEKSTLLAGEYYIKDTS